MTRCIKCGSESISTVSNPAPYCGDCLIERIFYIENSVKQAVHKIAMESDMYAGQELREEKIFNLIMGGLEPSYQEAVEKGLAK